MCKTLRTQNFRAPRISWYSFGDIWRPFQPSHLKTTNFIFSQNSPPSLLAMPRCTANIGHVQTPPNPKLLCTKNFMVHESFEFGGFCTWPRLAVHHGTAIWLGGEFCEKMKFVIFEMWGLERQTNVPKRIPCKSWCMKILSSVGFAHGQAWRCTTA